MSSKRQPLHPGKVMKREFAKWIAKWKQRPNSARFAAILGVPRGEISRVLSCRAPMNADLALRLEKILDRTAKAWMDMQTAYDLWRARRRAARRRAARISRLDNTLHITGRVRVVQHRVRRASGKHAFDHVTQRTRRA
jgi:addiction module HigA family antidote